MYRRVFSQLALTGLLGLIYFGAGRLGLMFALVNPSATAVWPTTGIALAGFLLLGDRVWPGILVGAFLVNVTTSGSVAASLLIAAGNTLEGLIGAYLVKRFARGRQAFDRTADVFKFAVLAGLISTAVSATFGVTSLALNGLASWAEYGPIWLTWWLGDAGGALIVAPVLILWAGRPRWRWNLDRGLEAVLLLASLILLALVVFGGLSSLGANNYPLEFLIVPLIIWAAYRFGQREAATATMVLATIAIWGTLHGTGPFAQAAPNESLLLLQAFMGMMAITGLSLAAVVAERQQIEAALREANERLRGGLSELEQRNQVMTRLNDMSDLLQSCLTESEAYAVIRQWGPGLFPQEAGGVYMINASHSLVQAAAVWGQPPPEPRGFALDDCWALRRGRLHLVSADQPRLLCPHLTPPLPPTYVCVPMIAHGETLGVLHVQLPGEPPAGSAADRGEACLSEAKQQLAQTVADSLALALANLRLRQTLRQQSIHDPLTGLFNRRYLEETLEREVQRAARGQRPLGLLMLDLDHFKEFNDAFGHEAGDVLLRELGNFLQARVRGADVACRYGGEEFTLLLPEAPLAAVEQRAEQLRQAIKHLRLPYPQQSAGPVTLSLGVAVFPQHGSTGEAILRAADAALYRAKREGRDRVVVADAMEWNLQPTPEQE